VAFPTVIFRTHVCDSMSGGPGADVFSCGEWDDTITDYNLDEGDVKAAADCEDF
jgi:hypothetical protein